MKDVKDFDMNEFMPDSSTTGTTVTTATPVVGDATLPIKRGLPSVPSELTGRAETAGQTVPTPSSAQTAKSRQTVSTLPDEKSVLSQQVEHSRQSDFTQPTGQAQVAQLTASSQQRISTRQRRASLDEYRDVFLTIPRITDRQPVFVSRDIRDKIDRIVRLLGERKMSVSGFLENLARHHLDLYADDLEQWRRL